MGGVSSPVSLGWDQDGEVRAWASRNQSFSSRVHYQNLSQDADDSVRRDFAFVRQNYLLSLPKPLQEKLDSLAEEKNPEMFRAQILHFARSLLQDGAVQAAYATAQILAKDSRFPELSLSARNLIQTMRGQGPLSDSFEFSLPKISAGILDPVNILGMTVAGLVFRGTRLWSLKNLLASDLSGFLAKGLEARTLSWFTALACETTAFTATQIGLSKYSDEEGEHPSFAKTWALNALLFGPLHLSQGISERTLQSWLQGPGRWEAVTRQVAPEILTLHGLVAGQQLQVAIGLREANGAQSAYAEGLLTLFQSRIGGNIAQRLLGPGFSALEKSLDLKAKSLGENPRYPRPPLFKVFQAETLPAFSAAGENANLIPESWQPEHAPIQKMSSIGEGRGSEQRLFERYRNLFPNTEVTFADDIVGTVLKIPEEIPDLHDRLLSSMVRDPRVGSLKQYEWALALEDIFKTDSLGSSVGSLDYALIQLAVGDSLMEENAPRRLALLAEIFQEYSQGLTRAKVESFLERNGLAEGMDLQSLLNHATFPGFRQRYERESEIHWRKQQHRAYSKDDRQLLLHWIHHLSIENVFDPSYAIQVFAEARSSGRYPIHEIDAALELSRTHRQGRLILQRLFRTFESQDTPAKLREFFSPPENMSANWNFPAWLKLPDPSSQAEAINGSAETAYFEDLRVARKVASVTQEVLPFLQNPQLRAGPRQNLIDGFWTFIRSGKPLTNMDLFNLLEINSDTETNALILYWMSQKFDFEVVPDSVFFSEVKKWGDQSPCQHSIFKKAKNPEEKDIILIRQMPEVDLTTPSGQTQAFTELVNRMAGAMHEFEHWRHSSGNFAESASQGQSLSLKTAHREDRLKSEILAYLAEARWRARNLDEFFWENARLMGMPLAYYLRNVADQSYYGKK